MPVEKRGKMIYLKPKEIAMKAYVIDKKFTTAKNKRFREIKYM